MKNVIHALLLTKHLANKAQPNLIKHSENRHQSSEDSSSNNLAYAIAAGV
jgi:hypothetical protein